MPSSGSHLGEEPWPGKVHSADNKTTTHLTSSHGPGTIWLITAKGGVLYIFIHILIFIYIIKFLRKNYDTKLKPKKILSVTLMTSVI